MPFGHTYVNVNDEKCIRIGPNTTLRCKRKCAYNDSGVCFFPGEVEIGIKCKQFIREEDKPAPVMPKDTENPLFSSGMRCWVTATIYGRTAAEVTLKMKSYQNQYPREGYSTMTMKAPHQLKNGFWCAVIERYSTCD